MITAGSPEVPESPDAPLITTQNPGTTTNPFFAPANNYEDALSQKFASMDMLRVPPSYTLQRNNSSSSVLHYAAEPQEHAYDVYHNSTPHSAQSSPHRLATSTALRAIASPGSTDYNNAYQYQRPQVLYNQHQYQHHNHSHQHQQYQHPPHEAYQNHFNANHPLNNHMNVSNGSQHLLPLDYHKANVGYSAVPPSDYLCKLCFIPGHWLRSCTLYLERKRGNQLHQQLMSELNNNPANALISAELKQQYQKLSQQLYLSGTGANIQRPCGGAMGKSIPPDGYICRKCNCPGHWIQQCPYQQKTSVPPGSYICRICNTPGHWIYLCSQREIKPFTQPYTQQPYMHMHNAGLLPSQQHMHHAPVGMHGASGFDEHFFKDAR